MNNPYPSHRLPLFAQQMVATSQPLAAQAGLRMMQAGGTAVDAALASAIALTVLEPTSNGVGSDAFALVWDGQHLHGLNGSGRAPQAWTPERFAGRSRMPVRGWDTVTVPGAVDSWITLWRRWGKLPLAHLFEPAIHYARQGFWVAPQTAKTWQREADTLQQFPGFLETFTSAGCPPKVGDLFCHPPLADTLQEIAQTEGESFYRGRLAAAIVAHAQATGGALTSADLATHQSEWVTPLAHPYRDLTLHEIPPNGQGIAALIAIGILQHLDLAQYPVDSADSIHLQVEAMKIAFVHAHRYVCDRNAVPVPVNQLLDPDFLAQQAATIELHQAHTPTLQLPLDRGTVYVTAADAQGMMVSFIQSNFVGFGSGIVVPNTGISLHNRGHGFSLQAGHPNQVAGGKRPYHTILPGFITQAGQPYCSFGMVGGHMQPQGHVQLLIRMHDYGQNPQAAIDAPRWHVFENFRLSLESGFSPAIVDELRQRGHRIEPRIAQWRWGGAQIIQKRANGYCGASDSRKDGQAVGY